MLVLLYYTVAGIDALWSHTGFAKSCRRLWVMCVCFSESLGSYLNPPVFLLK